MAENGRKIIKKWPGKKTKKSRDEASIEIVYTENFAQKWSKMVLTSRKNRNEKWPAFVGTLHEFIAEEDSLLNHSNS
jgi:hypothetical protein